MGVALQSTPTDKPLFSMAHMLQHVAVFSGMSKYVQSVQVACLLLHIHFAMMCDARLVRL